MKFINILFVTMLLIGFASAMNITMEEKIATIDQGISPEYTSSLVSYISEKSICYLQFSLGKGSICEDIQPPTKPYIIDGNSVYFENSNGIINVYPALAEEIKDHTQYINYTYYPEKQLL